MKFRPEVYETARAAGVSGKVAHLRLSFMPAELASDPLVPSCKLTNGTPNWLRVLYGMARHPALKHETTLVKIHHMLENTCKQKTQLTINGLKKKGLIEISRLNHDSSYVFVMTDKGRYVLSKMLPHIKDFEKLAADRKRVAETPKSRRTLCMVDALRVLAKADGKLMQVFDVPNTNKYTAAFNTAVMMERCGLITKQRAMLSITDAGRKWLKENA